MREEIIERIKLIKHGKIPRGYKKTIIGMMPVDWKIARFDECASISTGLVDPKKMPYNNMKHIGPENIEKETGIVSRVQTAKEQGLISGKFVFDNDSIIYSKIRPKLNKVCMPDFCGICSADCYVIHMKDKVQRRYLYYYILSDNFLKQAISCSMRTKMPKVNQEELSSFKVILPQLMEQEKIVNILKLYDDKIRCLKTMIYDKIRFKKWLMQSLLTGKKRLSGFRDEWKTERLKIFLEEMTEKNKLAIISDVKSISNKSGFINQSEQFGKNVASSDLSNYKIVRKGYIAYNPSRINVGSIALYTEETSGVISPMYVVLKTKYGLHEKYFMYYVKTEEFNQRMKSQLSGSVRETLKFNDLCAIKIDLPSYNEQEQIVAVLETADKEIDLLEQKLDLIKQEKKAIMQLLLTGIVRVPQNKKGGF